MKNIEEWRDVIGYEGRYQVSSLGRVKSLRRRTKTGRNLSDAFMALHWHTNNYWVVWLRKEDRTHKKFFVHRLVAIAFIPNPDGLPVVNHIDRDRRNSAAINLEWVSFKDNTLHWMKHDREHKPVPADVPIDLADIPF